MFIYTFVYVCLCVSLYKKKRKRMELYDINNLVLNGVCFIYDN